MYTEGGIVTDGNNNDQRSAEEIVGTVVYIETEIEIPSWIGKSGGSGFFVARDKIVTCFHGLAGATKLTVTHVDTGRVYTVEGIIASDYENDLVLLKTAENEAIQLNPKKARYYSSALSTLSLKVKFLTFR